MANLLEPEDIEWNFVTSFGFETEHHAKYVNKEFGLEYETITKISKHSGQFLKPKRYYFITGQKKEYTDLQKLCDDWNEIKNYDDPNNEIFWEKKIIPVYKIKSVGKNI